MGRNVTVVGYDLHETKKELKKHAATIHCSNTLSLLQRKISNALLFHAYKELMVREEHEITVRELCRLINYHGHNHAVIKEALRGLISTVIEWNLIDEETQMENWTASSILASVSLEGPMCFYAYSPRMKQLLHSPSIFGKIDLIIQSKFRSSYGLALYENCIRYRGLPQTKWFDMALFKKLMGVVPGKYDIFRDFKRRVLDKAIDEVNTYSDLIIAAQLLREGKRPTKIRFTLKERPKKIRLGGPLLNPKISRNSEKLFNELEQVFHLSKKQIKALLVQYDVTYIQEKVQMIEASERFQTGKINNLAGYLLSAIKHDYHLPKLLNLPIQSDDYLDGLKPAIESILRAYQRYRENAIELALNQLSVAAKKDFMRAFFKYAEPVISTVLQLQRKKYNRENVMDSPQMSALLRQYAIQQLKILLMPFDVFVEQLDREQIAIWHRLKSLPSNHPVQQWLQEKIKHW